jgi:DNA topoisomerase IA
VEKTTPRISEVNPVQAAEFWGASLGFLDIGTLAAIGENIIDPLERFSLDEVGDKGADHDIANEEETKPVYVALVLWSLNNQGKYDEKGVRFPLAVVYATQDKTGALFPDLTMPPRINENYLEPGVKARDISIGERKNADHLLEEYLAALKRDETLVHGWRSVWNDFVAVLQKLAQVDDLDALEARLLPLARGSATSTKKVKQWRLCAAVYEAQESGAANIRKLYSSIQTGYADHAAELALFEQLCRPASQMEYASAIPDSANEYFLGHIDEYDSKEGKRPLFPLDASQRTAAKAILSLKPGQMQAVNGPPGSGKTSMLRAVVGSMWVHAALYQKPCPIIVACGATNQSVTNVIGAFGNAPHGNDKYHMAQRWIPHLISYGAYLPSKQVKKDKDKQEELAKLLCLQPARNGMLYEYWKGEEVLNPAKCLDYETIFLNQARKAFPNCPPTTLEEALICLWERLASCYADGLEFENNGPSQKTRAELAKDYLATLAATFWHADRLEQAELRIDALIKDPTDFTATQEFMDLAWRAECFHLAARYWEAQFLLSQRERLLSSHPKNVEEALRRLCMLTPCLVSTLHMVPKLAHIREENDGTTTKREYAFGLFDLLVVDEAGQSMPDLGAACFALAKRAAVVGDLKQLAPISQMTLWSEAALAKKAGLTKEELDGMALAKRSPVKGSVLGMARLVSRWKEEDDAGITLRYHYRCVPNIVRYCKELCYPTLKWRTKDEVDPQLPSMAWVEVDALPTPSGGSRRNTKEADEVIEWVIDQWPKWRVHPATNGKPIQDLVAIITPYAAQSRYFSEKLKKDIAQRRLQDPVAWPTEADVKKVVIGTVHRLQGAERPFVCFSLVEGPDKNDGSSFVDTDPSMLNVAVSRAKKSFIVFANPERLFHTVEQGGLERENAPGTAPPKEKPSHALGRYLKRQGERLYPKRLVIIEASGKLKTLSRILGKESAVVATKGALLELPLHCGVDVGQGMAPRPELRAGGDATLARIAQMLPSVKEVVIATDDDRMGELIGWQVQRLLGKQLESKIVHRVRLSAMTKAAVGKAFAAPSTLSSYTVVAEAAREVADCLISTKLTALNGQTAELDDDFVQKLQQIGALTLDASEARQPKARAVGRVQAAILRMLLNKARAVAFDYEARKIRVDATCGTTTVTGWLYHVDKNDVRKETTTAKKANDAVARLSATRLEKPVTVKSSASPLLLPDAGTAVIMAQAWSRHALPPWKTMQLMQELYDGSWSGDAEITDPIDPIEVKHDKGGHPPVRPLDAKAPPEVMRAKMGAEHLNIYTLIWEYWQASQLSDLFESFLSVDCHFAGYPRVRVFFDGLTREGVPSHLNHVAFPRPGSQPVQSYAQLDSVVGMLDQATLSLTAEAAVHWDYGIDALLWDMTDARIGRPSTYANALGNMHKHGLIAVPDAAGPLQLTLAGLATALLLEKNHPRISDPGYSSTLLADIDAIEKGKCTARDVLTKLSRVLDPPADHDTIGSRIWRTLPELEAALNAHEGQETPSGAVIASTDLSWDGANAL